MRHSTGSGGLYFSFFACFSPGIQTSFTHVPRQGPELKDLRKTDFWTGLQGIGMTSPSHEHSSGKQDQPDKGARPQTGKSTSPDKKQTPNLQPGKTISGTILNWSAALLLFLIRAGIIFLELRLIWLVVQYAGEIPAPDIHVGKRRPSDRSILNLPGPDRNRLSACRSLAAKIRRSPLSFVLHPFMRLRLMLSGFQKNVSSEELFEKERRVVEADWHILYGSWGPYRCLFWVLPILGLAQTALLLIAQFNVASSGFALLPQKEALEAAKPMLGFTASKGNTRHHQAHFESSASPDPGGRRGHLFPTGLHPAEVFRRALSFQSGFVHLRPAALKAAAAKQRYRSHSGDTSAAVSETFMPHSRGWRTRSFRNRKFEKRT